MDNQILYLSKNFGSFILTLLVQLTLAKTKNNYQLLSDYRFAANLKKTN